MLKKYCFLITILLLIPVHLVYANETVYNQPELSILEPNSNTDVITRGEAVDAIYQMIIQEGKNKSNSKTGMNYLYVSSMQLAKETLQNPYEDLNENDQYYKAMVILHDLRIYNGVKDGKKIFANSAAVLTREEGFILIDNIGFSGNNPHSRLIFEDASEISEFAYNAVNDLVDMWLISGYPDHTIRPKDPMKQEDFLNLLNKAMKSPSRPADQDIDSEEYYQSTIQDEHITKLIEVVLKDDIVTSLESSIYFRFNNYTNTRLGYGVDNFVIEIQKEGKWYIVPMRGVDSDLIAYSLPIGESNPEYFFETKLKRYFNHLEDGHYRIIFRLTPERERKASEFIPYKPYEDLLCMQEFDVLISEEK